MSCGTIKSLPIINETDGLPEEELCRCPGGMSEKFLLPCLLMLLHQGESYGYGLLEELPKLGLTTDASVVYRNLRRMEKEGLVQSRWDTQESGPAKRVYTITPEGQDLMHSWVATIKKNRDILNHFLDNYEHLFPKSRKKPKKA